MMKRFTLLLFLVAGALPFAQAQFVTTPPASKKASVSEWIGLTEVTIDYSRPGVKEREIYGENALVPYDGGTPFPWRAGANNNTTIFFEHDVKINGQNLAAGKYGFHIIPAENEWTLIFSNNNHSWGSFNYDISEDALRVTARPSSCDHMEWLSYEFVNQTDNTADIQLSWEKKKVSFTVDVDVYKITKASIAREIDNLKGFSWQGSNSAATYHLNAEKDLDLAMTYAQRAANRGLGGQVNFTTLSTQSQILAAMDKPAEAKEMMDKALPLATMTELHFYGRSLIQAKKPKEAMKIFQMNRDNNPDDNFTTFVGLARGNMALENYGDAAKYFYRAAPNAPQGQQQIYEGLAKQCEEKM